VVEHAAADHLPSPSIEGGERQQTAALSERRHVPKRRDQLFAPERRQVSGLANLRIGKRRQDRVDVVD
jgi:hypothetical protein